MNAIHFAPPVAFYLPIAVLLGIMILAAAGIWIWGLVECVRNPRLDKAQRRTWFLVILLLNFIGAGLYFANHRETGPSRSGARPA